MGIPPPPGAIPPAPGPWTPTPAPMMMGYSTYPPGSPFTREAELRSVRALRIAGILALVGVLLGLIVPYAISAATGAPNVFGATNFIGVSGTGNNTTIHFNTGVLWTILGIAVAGGVLTILSLIFFRQSFTSLKGVDSRFSTPATLAMVGLIGLIIVILGAVVLFDAFAQLSGCVFSANVFGRANTCAGTLVLLILGIAVLGIGGIVALIGYIGILIGVWRVGVRYDSTLLKVAAILWIFPYVNVVAGILIRAETTTLAHRLEGQPGMPMSGPGVPPPPPPMMPPPLR
jgi:hypothetical protein